MLFNNDELILIKDVIIAYSMEWGTDIDYEIEFKIKHNLELTSIEKLYIKIKGEKEK